ncbi:hypothetical protein B0H19DRAFT_1190229 [Mycena capillaripes]|nr:hypothetical protein B0H19DRAFT_1190229 [Mycena capillaripes]
MPRAGSSSESPRKKRQDSASPRKAKTASPGIQKRRKEWNESLPPLWVKEAPKRHDGGYMNDCERLPILAHSISLQAVTKANAKEFKLTDREIGTLPYEEAITKAGFLTKLYREDQLMELAKRKCAKLEVELKIGGLVYHSHSGSSATGSVSIVSLKNAFKPADWEEHTINPQPPPLKLVEYSWPPQAEKPDPENIIWTPSWISGPVTVDDACRLYCIEPADIQHLSAHSRWIDLATVAKRALALHGGFYKHKELVLRQRRAEEEMLTRTISDADKRESHFRFSPMIRKQWEDNENDDGMYDIIGGSTIQRHAVAVLYPISYHCNDDYGCDWKWIPGTCQPILTIIFLKMYFPRLGRLLALPLPHILSESGQLLKAAVLWVVISIFGVISVSLCPEFHCIIMASFCLMKVRYGTVRPRPESNGE